MPTLDWIGKNAVANHHNEVPYRLIHCDDNLSVGDVASGNLLVQGDNLEALKALLPYYRGQVKCIYIDPPYNTGNENWVYNDNVNSPEIRAWLDKVVGKEGEDLSRHDKWLCMMYPRLKLLKKFLRNDGVIAVSSNEFEHRHLALLMDELFGSHNRIESIVWKKSYGGGSKSKYVVNNHEYIELFAKFKSKIQQLDLPPSSEALKYYKFEDEKAPVRGPYRLQPLATTSMDDRPNLRYPITYNGFEIWPEKQWQWSLERVQRALGNNDLVFSKKDSKWTVHYKQYLRDELGNERRSKLGSIIEGIYTQSGTATIKEILGDGKAFDFPKPFQLVQILITLCARENDLILDSFAGSGTTGHAVLDLNKQDGGNRKFILVEMDKSISKDVTAQRLSKVIDGYNKGGDPSKPVAGLGGGFRFCKLGDPLFDEMGYINASVSFSDLAAHVFFVETGTPIPARASSASPLIGTFNNVAIYLLFAPASLGQQNIDVGNVLTPKILDDMLASRNASDTSFVIYAEGCTVSEEQLKAANVTFKQIPYTVAGA